MILHTLLVSSDRLSTYNFFLAMFSKISGKLCQEIQVSETNFLLLITYDVVVAEYFS